MPDRSHANESLLRPIARRVVYVVNLTARTAQPIGTGLEKEFLPCRSSQLLVKFPLTSPALVHTMHGLLTIVDVGFKAVVTTISAVLQIAAKTFSILRLQNVYFGTNHQITSSSNIEPPISHPTLQQPSWRKKVQPSPSPPLPPNPLFSPTYKNPQLTPPPTAKSRTVAVRLISMALTGYYRTLRRPRAHRPLSMLKYDPVGTSSTAAISSYTRGRRRWP